MVGQALCECKGFYYFFGGEKMKEGIVVASFGTSYKETRKNCIERIENKIKERFTDYEVLRAFTSNMVIKRIKAQESLETHTVETAIEAMANQGIKKIYIQPLQDRKSVV